MADRLKILHGHLIAGCNQLSASAGVSTSSAFKYTVDNSKLNYEQRKFYEENGFLVIKKLVSPEKLKKLSDRFADICKREVIVPGMTIMRDVAIKNSEFVPGEQAVTKIQDFQQDEVMFQYCCLPEVVEYVECFTGPDVVAMHTMLINKPPDSGLLTSRHPLHQDLYYFPFRPADRIVCSWTAMQKINRENGCLVVVPGTHTGELLVHEYPKWEGGVNKMYYGIQNYNPNQPILYLEMEEGDTIFFHPLLIHGSGANRSKGFRKSISCHYASGKAHYVGTVSQVLVDEYMKVVRRKFGPDVKMTYMDFWKLKSRTIKGDNQLNLS